MNRRTHPLANRPPIQSRCFDLRAHAGDVIYGHARTTILRERRGGRFSLDSGLADLRVRGELTITTEGVRSCCCHGRGERLGTLGTVVSRVMVLPRERLPELGLLQMAIVGVYLRSA